MNASFYDGAANIALHTDICSPLATDPTWSRLGDERESLAADGVGMWHDLVRVLEPDVIPVSVARRHLEKIQFRPLDDWRVIHVVERANPYKVEARRYEITEGKFALVVFGRAANLPFGTVSGGDKYLISRRIAAVIDAR